MTTTYAERCQAIAKIIAVGHEIHEVEAERVDSTGEYIAVRGYLRHLRHKLALLVAEAPAMGALVLDGPEGPAYPQTPGWGLYGVEATRCPVCHRPAVGPWVYCGEGCEVADEDGLAWLGASEYGEDRPVWAYRQVKRPEIEPCTCSQCVKPPAPAPFVPYENDDVPF